VVAIIPAKCAANTTNLRKRKHSRISRPTIKPGLPDDSDSFSLCGKLRMKAAPLKLLPTRTLLDIRQGNSLVFMPKMPVTSEARRLCVLRCRKTFSTARQGGIGRGAADVLKPGIVGEALAEISLLSRASCDMASKIVTGRSAKTLFMDVMAEGHTTIGRLAR
jgi:hypothetical protein